MRQVLMIMSLLLSSSCVSVSEMRLAPLETPAPHPTKKLHIYSRWTVESSSMSEDLRDATADLYRQHFIEAMERHGCCEAADIRDEADIVLRARTTKESRVGVYLWSLVTGLTLYIVPSWVKEELSIQASVQVGKQTFEHSWQDSTTIYQWLPLIVAMPFMDGAIPSIEHLEDRVFDHIVADAYRDFKARGTH